MTGDQRGIVPLSRRAALGLISGAALSSCVPATGMPATEGPSAPEPVSPGESSLEPTLSPTPSTTPTPSAEASPTGPSPTVAGTVLLDVVDESGRRLSLAELRQIQSNGAGEAGQDDMLLHAVTLQAVQQAPLQETSEATAALEIEAGGPWTLSLSWPTSHGYSALLADLPGPGHYDLLELAARGLYQRQATRLAGAEPDAEVAAARQETQVALDQAAAADTASARGLAARQALEAAATAQLGLDRQRVVEAPADAVLGVTLTRPPSTSELNDLRAISSEGRRLGVRLVIDDSSDADEMAEWRAAAARLQAANVLVMGQICDSQVMADLDDAGWDQRVTTLVSALPGLDAWEVGNELGGDWAGEQQGARALRAADYVRAHTSATTVLTLYYQLGQDTVETSTFTWAAAEVNDELRQVIDVVGLSIYPQWHPLGTSADRVLQTLAEAFPTSQVAVTELSYGAEDLDPGPWWFGSDDDPVMARQSAATQVTAAALAQPSCWGAPFWWYYLEDEAGQSDGGPVSDTLTTIAAPV